MQTVGVDLVELARIQQVLERHGDRFLERTFTLAEQAYCARRVACLAARWAAKEAVSKALGTGWEGISWLEIEIERAPSGQPSIRLHGAAAQRARELGIRAWAISLSHERTYAIAFVSAES